MSEGDLDKLFALWAASHAPQADASPFANHKDLHDTIDATELGDISWEKFTLSYEGPKPDEAGETPTWMTDVHDIWFRDPRKIINNMLSNPDFQDEFDYSPLQEYDNEGNHRYQNFMSGNWAWKQAVNILLS